MPQTQSGRSKGDCQQIRMVATKGFENHRSLARELRRVSCLTHVSADLIVAEATQHFRLLMCQTFARRALEEPGARLSA